jgi:hypothetical protein
MRGCSCNPSSLRERFGQDHSWNKRIVRKMSGKHRIVFREMRFAFRRHARLALDQLPNENKRRPMRQTKKVTSDEIQMSRSSLFLSLVTRHRSLLSPVDKIGELPASLDAQDAGSKSVII